MNEDNIVRASFVFGKTAKTRGLYQWDYGQVLQFEKLDLPAAYTVHFANQPMSGNAKTQVGGPDGVTIPDEYLTTGLPVYAWVFLHAGADDGETVYMVTIPVTKRPKPVEDEPTPVQQGAIDQAIAALNTAVTEAEGIRDAIPETVNSALEEAKESGEFDGPKGDKGDTGESGVYIGNETPTDDDIRVWIKPNGAAKRIDSLDATKIVKGAAIIDAVGIPVYVNDLSQYSEYGLTEKGWYLFAQIKTPDESPVTADTHVYGANAVIPVGLDYIKVAVRFPVAALSQTVDVEWADRAETFIFRATDLALRNLDSRITFYIYDISPFATWTYALTTDTTFAANKNYYTESDGVYTLAEVTVGEAVPENTYYNHSKLHFEGMTRNVTYRLDEVVDCPIEIALPEVEDDGYGAWFEIQMRYNASYSCTLLPPTEVKIGTAQTQAQTAGINTIDLQYTDVDDVKMWTLLNTHSNIPTT